MSHSWSMTMRCLRALWREPAWIFVTLLQPVVWLLLFGALFKRIVDIPGFTAESYIDFLAPGIVIMTAVFSAGWSGMGFIEDMNRGVMDRFLTSPARRVALIAGPVAQNAITIAIQSLIIVGLALVVGAEFPGGVAGALVLLVSAVLLGAAISSLSNGIALIVRKEETLIAIVQFITLPLTFLSTAFMQKSLIPGWMQDVTEVNPVDWAVVAGREALGEDVDWGVVLGHLGLLAALAVLCVWFATRAFRAYQRSM